nr:reverse transcriptase domain-containing protein [Tanacetum cinerariifolium]
MKVNELKKAGILRETRYQTWLANTVMVKKTEGAWRMCVDFAIQNKACPKDCYSLPEIDWKVESLFDYKLKCFLDVYKGYHQIQMAKEDEHKRTFHAPKEVYCYKKMPFGLKNTGSTYHRLVDKVFESQIGRNMEAYVDDMVIKNIDEQDMLEDIQETFQKGKIQALTSIKRPRTTKEVQSLNEKLAALNRFLSKSTKKSLPFFKILKKCREKKDFTWTREADKAFEEMKKYIEKLLTLVAPKDSKSLIVYLTASIECISTVLMAGRGKDQRPIFFMSRVLQGAELNYPTIEKLVITLIHAVRRLKRYFKAHKLTVLTNKPIRQLLLKPKKSRRVARWAIELKEHEIEFEPRNVIKTQILVDFLAETQEEDNEADFQSQKRKEKTQDGSYILMEHQVVTASRLA